MDQKLKELIHQLGVITFANEDFDKPRIGNPNFPDSPGLTPEEVIAKATESLVHLRTANGKLQDQIEKIWKIVHEEED